MPVRTRVLIFDPNCSEDLAWLRGLGSNEAEITVILVGSLSAFLEEILKCVDLVVIHASSNHELALKALEAVRNRRAGVPCFLLTDTDDDQESLRKRAQTATGVYQVSDRSGFKAAFQLAVESLKLSTAPGQVDQDENVAREECDVSIALVSDLIEGIPNGLAIVNPQGRTVVSNAIWKRLCELSRTQFSEATEEAPLDDLPKIFAFADGDTPRLETEFGRLLHFELQEFELEFSTVNRPNSRWIRIRASWICSPKRLILVSIEDISAKRLAGIVSLDNESSLQAALERAHVGTWNWDVQAKKLYWTRYHEELFGFDPGTFTGTYEEFNRAIHPEDRQGIKEALAKSSTPGHIYNHEFRVVWPDGSLHWVVGHGSFTFDDNGQAKWMFGVILDVTAKKEAEAAIRENGVRLEALSRQLIKVEEAERKRLACELHDEIGQSLTAIKINLQISLNSVDPENRSRLSESQALVEQVLQQVRDLSLDLRPTLLDDFGLIDATRWYVKRFAERSQISATFSTDIEFLELSPELDTVCFRIVQEALTNVARHARASRVKVSMEYANKLLILRIEDNGIGFVPEENPSTQLRGGSLGLIGMRERVSLARGKFLLRSTPGSGTLIQAEIPTFDIH